MDVFLRVTEIVPLLYAFRLHRVDDIAYATVASLGQYRATGLIVRGESVAGFEFPVALAKPADFLIDKTISNRLLSSDKGLQEAQRED